MGSLLSPLTRMQTPGHRNTVCLVHSHSLRIYTVPGQRRQLHSQMRTNVYSKLWRGRTGTVGGKKSPKSPPCQLPACCAFSQPGKEQSLVRPCRAHAPCPWGHRPETTTPGPETLRCFQVEAMREGAAGSGPHPLSQAPAEFNSKVQSAFASSQIKVHSAGEMSWLIKAGGGPWKDRPPPLPAHTLCR